MNFSEDESTISHHIENETVDGVDKRKIFVKPIRKYLAHRILYATCELNPPFSVDYYLIHTRSNIAYIIRQLKINYPNKIKGNYSLNNETYILYNIRDYSSDGTSTPSLDETENRALDNSENQTLDETEN